MYAIYGLRKRITPVRPIYVFSAYIKQICKMTCDLDNYIVRYLIDRIQFGRNQFMSVS